MTGYFIKLGAYFIVRWIIVIPTGLRLRLHLHYWGIECVYYTDDLLPHAPFTLCGDHSNFRYLTLRAKHKHAYSRAPKVSGAISIICSIYFLDKIFISFVIDDFQ